MYLSKKDNILIECHFKEKGWRRRRLIFFPNKSWNRKSIAHLIKKIEVASSHERGKDSGKQNIEEFTTNDCC